MVTNRGKAYWKSQRWAVAPAMPEPWRPWLPTRWAANSPRSSARSSPRMVTNRGKAYWKSQRWAVARLKFDTMNRTLRGRMGVRAFASIARRDRSPSVRRSRHACPGAAPHPLGCLSGRGAPSLGCASLLGRRAPRPAVQGVSAVHYGRPVPFPHARPDVVQLGNVDGVDHRRGFDDLPADRRPGGRAVQGGDRNRRPRERPGLFRRHRGRLHRHRSRSPSRVRRPACRSQTRRPSCSRRRPEPASS